MSILLIRGDARSIPLADNCVHCVVTSPPYWNLRNYDTPGQLGLEKTPEEYVRVMVDVFREVRRVMRHDATLWLNMGNSYCSGISSARTRETPETGITRELPRNWVIKANKIERNGTPPGWKAKDLVPTSWMLALALRADGWYLRSDIIWSKGNPMPESVSDRPTKAHEYIFLLSKSERYYYDQEAILEPVSENTHMRLSQNLALQVGSHRANGGGKTNGPMKAVGRKAKQDETGNRRYTGFNERWKVKHNASFDASVCLPVNERNKRTVWTVNAQGFAEAHFATFPEDLIKPCILAGCPSGGTVLDPFIGSGTTALVARNLQCNAIGLELSPVYLEIAKRRLRQDVFSFTEAE